MEILRPYFVNVDIKCTIIVRSVQYLTSFEIMNVPDKNTFYASYLETKTFLEV